MRAAGLRAAAIAMQGCSARDVDACAHLGYLYLRGYGVTKDLQRARALLSSACDKNVMRACHNLGVLLYQSANATQAVELFKRACQAGDGAACTALGAAHHTGIGADLHLTKAIEFYGDGCKRGHADGCAALGAMQARGEGMERDPETAAKVLTAACDHGSAHGCQHLAALIEAGDGVPPNPANRERALALYLQACRGGDAVGCTRAGPLLDTIGAPRAPSPQAIACTGPDCPQQTVEALLRSCARGAPDACRALGKPGPVNDPGF
jgi:TPR repeat protein